MSPPPRSLTFAVGTSLLTASLATTGCSKPRVNQGPEPPHVNTAAPTTDDTTEPTPESPPADDTFVNTVPSEPSEPAPE
jgi:hypothetical protein